MTVTQPWSVDQLPHSYDVALYIKSILHSPGPSTSSDAPSKKPAQTKNSQRSNASKSLPHTDTLKAENVALLKQKYGHCILSPGIVGRAALRSVGADEHLSIPYAKTNRTLTPQGVMD